VLDLAGFWQPLLDFLDGAVESGFLRPANRGLVVRITDVDDVLAVLGGHHTPENPVLLGPDET
jgi:predicted Rossmann-fold nucleotide-binding protein